MRKLVLASGLAGLMLTLVGPPVVAGASGAPGHLVRMGTRCKAPANSIYVILDMTCSNPKVTGGSGSFDFTGGFTLPTTIDWANGKATTVAWTSTQVTGPDEREGKAKSCLVSPLMAHDGVIEYDVTGTVTSDNTGGLPVRSTATAEECLDLDAGYFYMEPGSKLVIG